MPHKSVRNRIGIEAGVIGRIDEIRNQDKEPIEIALALCMYCIKTQLFKDGNKRASVIFASHYLIAKGNGCYSFNSKI